MFQQPGPGALACATRREQEIILLVARGMQNKNIAYELKLSENTVRAHIQNIMRKYNLQNRTQIAVMFARADTHSPAARLGNGTSD